MKITGYICLFIAAILYADLAFAVECESSEGYQTCVYEPGEFIFTDDDSIREFIDSKELEFIRRGTTTILPNKRNLPLGSIMWTFANRPSGAIYGIIQRTPSSEIELLTVSLPEKGA